MKTQWKAVPDFEGIYEVSDAGEVRRIIKAIGWPLGRLLSGDINKGYRRVRLFGNGKHARFWVHRLVLEAFCGPIPKDKEPNHKNGNRSDNRLSNLEMLTRSENNLHAYRVLGRRRNSGSFHGRSKLTETQVLEIRRLAVTPMKRKDIAALFSVGQSEVSVIVNRKNWTHI